MIRVALILAGLGMLTACTGSDQPAAADATAPAAAAPAARQKTVFDDQLKALEKAKGVEKQLQDEKARRDQELDAAGG